MQKSTLVMTIGFAIYAFVLYSILSVLKDTWQGYVFGTLMIGIFFYIVFNKNINSFLEKLDEE
jgi:uncharacterized membrane protein YfcA